MSPSDTERPSGCSPLLDRWLGVCGRIERAALRMDMERVEELVAQREELLNSILEMAARGEIPEARLREVAAQDDAFRTRLQDLVDGLRSELGGVSRRGRAIRAYERQDNQR